MSKSIPQWQIGGFLFTSVLGTFLHFLFDLTGGSLAAALISAVNESIWEHMKLLFYPMVLFAMLEYRFWGKDIAGFRTSKLAGILLGLALIPVTYYTYTGVLGVSADWFNISIFFLAAGAAFRYETKLLQRGAAGNGKDRWAVMGLVFIAVLFTVLTFFPPRIPFFRDPVTGTYGYQDTENAAGIFFLPEV